MTAGTDDQRRLFFVALVAVTLLPYAAFPILSGAAFGTGAGLRGVLVVLLFLGAAGHVASSFFYYADPSVRTFMAQGHRRRYFIVPLLLLVVVGVAYQLLDAVGRAYFLVVFWVWQVHHFTRQNHGILSFASASYGAPILPAERLAITLTDVAAILATLSFVTPYRDTVLAGWGWHMHSVGLLCCIAAWIVWLGSRPWQRVAGSMPREGIVLMLMLFYLPLFLFENAFMAVYVYLTAHGLQYLVFMTWVAKTPRRSALRAGIWLVVLTVVGGFAIRELQNDLVWARYGVTLLGVAYAITMWHFLLDAGVWKLSGSFQRGYMRERFPFLAPSSR